VDRANAERVSAGLGFRAFLAWWLIGWFCLFGLAVVVGFCLAVVWELWYLGHPGVLSLAGAALALLVARWISFLVDRGDAPGLEVSERNQPGLMETVRRVPDRVNSRMPERVLLIPDAGIACMDRCRFPGVSWWRELRIGMALLDRLSVGAVRAILAGELSKEYVMPSRRQALICRLDSSLYRALVESRRSFLTSPLEWYLRVFLMVTRPLNAKQRATAEARAARAVGREVYAQALAQGLQTSHRFMLFLQQEVLVLLTAGGLPDNIYQGFRVWLSRTEAGRGEDRRFEDAVTEPLDWLDDVSLPAERLAAIRSLPDGPPWDDPSPARGLIERPEEIERVVTPFIAETFHRQGLRRLERRPKLVPWQDVEGKIIVPQQRARAEHVIRILERMLSRHVDPLEGIDIYLRLIEVPELKVRLAGRLDPNLARIPPTLHPQLVQSVLIRFLGTLVGNTLVEKQDYRWEKGIAEPLKVVGSQGEHLDPFSLAGDLLEGRLHVGSFRMRLFEHGLFMGR
jgi:heat shock protein HtpX